jgi:hypothetical protein
MDSNVITSNPILNQLLQQFASLISTHNSLTQPEISTVIHNIFEEIVNSQFGTLDIHSDYTIRWIDKFLDENDIEQELTYELTFLSTQIAEMVESKKRIRDVTNHLPKYRKIKEGDVLLDHVDVCAICHDNYKVNEFKRELNICGHTFHKKCIDKWFISNTNLECQLCRQSYEKQVNSNT